MSTLNPNAPAFIPQWTWSTGNGTPLFTPAQAREWGNAQAQANAQQVSNIQQNVGKPGKMAGAGLAASAAMGIGSGLMDLIGTGITAGVGARNLDKQLSQQRELAEQGYGLEQQRIDLEKQLSGRSLDIQQQSLDFNIQNVNKMWQAAQSAGLYSITQLGDASNTDFYKVHTASPIPNRVKRASGLSPFSF